MELNTWLSRLESEGGLSPTATGRILTTIRRIQDHRGQDDYPIYLRALFVFGGWFATFFGLIFVFIFGVTKSAPALGALGLLMIGGALLLHRARGMIAIPAIRLFIQQLGFSASVAGHILFFVASAEGLGRESLALWLITAESFLCALVLYPLYDDATHRYCSTLGFFLWFMGSAAAEGYGDILKINLALTVATVYLTFILKPLHGHLRPLGYSAITAMAILLFSAIPINPFFKIRSLFFHLWDVFPRLYWIPDNLLLGGAIFMTLRHIAGPKISNGDSTQKTQGIALLVLAIFTTPGILAALWILLLAKWRDEKPLFFGAIACFLFYLFYYYYFMGVSFLAKSILLVLTGIICFSLRLLIPSSSGPAPEFIA